MKGDEYDLKKIFALAQLAGKRAAVQPVCDADRAVEEANDIFNAAERFVAGGKVEHRELSIPERMRRIRLAEKLRANTLDGDERAELADLIQGDVR